MKNVMLLAIIISIFSLAIALLQGRQVQNKKPHYKTRHNYPLGVDRIEYDKIWHDEEEFEEDDELYTYE